ncbi:MAG: ATP-binding cassette domain-containing protein [Verrucomicrobiae bacterium]|nr:ATP-binding cassette domain-containing protein [Verrucomicrobiae bacterium]
MNSLQVYRRLWPYLKPYKFRFFIGFVLGLAFAASDGGMLLLFQKLLRRFLESKGEEHTLWEIGRYAMIIPAFFLVRGLCDYFNKYFICGVGMRAVMDLRNKLFAHIHTLSLDFFNSTPVGDLVSRITNDAVFAQKAVSGAASDLLKEPFVFIALIVVMLRMDWQFSLVAMILVPICLLPVAIYGRKVKKSTKGSQKNLADTISLLTESFTGVRIVKAFSMEETENQQFRKNSKKLFRYFFRVAMASEILGPIIELISAVGLVAAFLYAYHLGMDWAKFGVIGFGLFKLYGPIKKLSKVHMVLQSAAAATERIFQVLAVQPSVIEKPDARTLPTVQRQIEFDHVHFSYDQSVVLDDIHFTATAGKLIAIVGTSGAGKSTLVNLIPRFYDAGTGSIRIDDVNIRDVTLASLRKQIAMVTQDVILFDDSVANNIAVGRPGATREEIIDAAKRANAHSFIEQMTNGYDSEIGERGVRLSGGQRQRLAIARAILKNAPILILDEATSSLDTESERFVQEALDDLMQQRTSFVIAHRLSTVQHADTILVIDKGRIVESGRHAELLARGGIYKRLYDLQFKD